MSKKFLTFVFVIGTLTVTQAQTIIPKIGFVVSSTNATPPDDEFGTKNELSSGTGFTFGVGYNHPIGTVGKGLFSLQPELSFIQKGFKATTSGETNIGEAYYDYVADQHYKINYLELPVLAKIEFGSPTARFSFLAGPSIGFGLGGKLKGDLTLDDGYEKYKNDIDADIKFGDAPEDAEEIDDVYFDNRLDFGLQLGAGVTLYNKVAIEVRYGLGFTNLSDDHDTANRVLQFTVGVPFQLK
ncbi:MAG TPA: porin family protein [Ohtaekwangia sp.]